MVTFKFAVLQSFAGFSPQHKTNLLGQRFQAGSLEAELEMSFTDDERALCSKAVEELKQSGFLRPTYNDISDPENWLEITENGRTALSQNVLDDLDVALRKINPSLCDLRYAASQRLLSDDPDAKRQAAQSARELIRQVLDIQAPSEAIKAQRGFQPSKDSKDGITRKMRIRYMIEKRPSGSSKSDVEIVEKACDLIEALHGKLSSEAHRDVRTPPADVKDLITETEIALRKLLL